MGCSLFCKPNNKTEEIKSIVDKKIFEKEEPIKNELNILLKENIGDKKVSDIIDNEEKYDEIMPLQITNKYNSSITNKFSLSQKTIKPKLTNFTSKIQNIEQIKEEISYEERQMLKKTFKEHFLFKNKSSNLILSIISSLETMTLEKNIVLFNKGDEGENFFIIKKGRILIETEYGRKYLKEGSTFGELALIQNGKRTATARAMDKCILYVLNGADFRKILKKINETDLNEKINLIKVNPIFNSLPNNKLNAISNIMINCSFKGGEIIINKNDIGDSIYIIKCGEVQCIDKDENNNERKIRILKAKDYFGEGAVLFNMKRSLSIKVLEKSMECYQISKYNLELILGKDFRNNIISSICKNAFKKSKYMTYFINSLFFNAIFEKSVIKDYKDKEIVYNKNIFSTKFYVILMGNLIEENGKIILASRGELFGDVLIQKGKAPEKNIIAKYNMKAVEFDLNEIIVTLDIKPKSPENFDEIFKIMELVENLKKISLFKQTSSQKIIEIVKKMKEINYKENEIIFKEGEIGDKLYMIKSGRVKVFTQNKLVRELEEWSCFGEVALLLDEARTATIIASSNCSLLYLTKEAFTSVVDEKMLNYLTDKIYLEEGYNILLNNLFFVKKLGHGKFGNVCLVHNGRHFFAIKAVSRKAAEKQKILIKYFVQERNILLTLDNPFIMKFLKTFKTDKNIFFLLEYIQGRGFHKYLNSRPQTKYLNSQETLFYISNLLIALDYLNSRQVCHRDIKPENIIIDQKGYLKLIDFGTAKKIDKNYTSTITGTPHFIAPEVLLGQGYGFSCDYWSLGVIAYLIYYGLYPFGRNAKDPIEVYKEVIKKDAIYTEGDNKMKRLIDGFLTKNEAQRICSLDRAKQYEAFDNYMWNDLKEFKIIPQYIPKQIKLKGYEEYKLNYIEYLKENEHKTNDKDEILSYYDEDGVNYKYDENWADNF